MSATARLEQGQMDTQGLEFSVRLTDEADESIRKAVLDPLVAYNEAKTGRSDHRPLVVAIEDADRKAVRRVVGTHRSEMGTGERERQHVRPQQNGAKPWIWACEER